jgi:uncharacterized membrane protein
MHHRTLIILFLVLAIVFLAPAAFAQTPTPPDSGRACAPSMPCNDRAATTGLKLGGLAVKTAAPAAEAAAGTANAGFALAWAVMALLLLSLLYAIVAAVFATMGREFPVLPAGSRVLIPILSVLGLGVALYLTYVETQNVAAVCGPVGDCNAVQASPFAKLFGFLPVGLLGALGYVGLIVAWFVARSDGAYSRIAALLMFAMALFGVLFTIYLTYLELFIIHAVCIWCLSSAVLMSLVLILTVGPALEALQTEDLEAEEA